MWQSHKTEEVIYLLQTPPPQGGCIKTPPALCATSSLHKRRSLFVFYCSSLGGAGLWRSHKTEEVISLLQTPPPQAVPLLYVRGGVMLPMSPSLRGSTATAGRELFTKLCTEQVLSKLLHRKHYLNSSGTMCHLLLKRRCYFTNTPHRCDYLIHILFRTIPHRYYSKHPYSRNEPHEFL